MGATGERSPCLEVRSQKSKKGKKTILESSTPISTYNTDQIDRKLGSDRQNREKKHTLHSNQEMRSVVNARETSEPKPKHPFKTG